MNIASDKLRRAHPLLAKAVGFIFDQGVMAQANWDRFEVRTEQNQLLLEYEAQGHLLHQMEFIDNRYLVVSTGTGIMVTGFKVYDFLSSQWTLDIEGASVETGFCGTHPSAPVIAVEDNDGMGLWDLHEARRFSYVTMSESPNVAALGGPGNRIATGSFEKIFMIEQGREAWSAEVGTGDVTAMAWNMPQASLLCGDGAGNIMRIETGASRVVHAIGKVSEEIKHIRVSPDGKSAVATGYDGMAAFLDCENNRLTLQEDVLHAVFSPTDDDCLLVAGSAGIKRLAISSLKARS